MNHVMKVTIVFGMILFLLGATGGCKEKGKEEEIEELVEKLGEAKTEKEAEAIAKKIEKLEERAKKKSTKEIRVKLGQPITFWQKGALGEKETRFSITFERVSITKNHPILFTVSRTRAPEGKKYVVIPATLKNLGPRESMPEDDVEIRVDKGYLYRIRGLFKNPQYEPGPLASMKPLGPGKKGSKLFWCEIPENTIPIEAIGTLGGSGLIGGDTKFRLKLTQFNRSKAGREATNEGESVTKIRKISKDNIAGKYIAEIVKKDGTIERSPGVMIFREDGRIVLSSAGSEFVVPDQKWDFKNGVVHFYQHFSSEGWSEIYSGQLKGSTIICKIKDDREFDEFRWIREDGRPFSLTSSRNMKQGFEQRKIKSETFYDLIKEDEKRLRAEPSAKVKFRELSPEDKKQAERLFEMALTQRKIARLPSMGYKPMVDYCREIIKKYPKSLYAAKARRMLGDIPEKDRKQYNITDEEIGLSNSENKEKLAQQIDTRLKVYSDRNLLPSLPISITLRMTAADLVEKAESIHFAALDYQFLSLKSLRYAKYFLDGDDISQVNKYIEKADRYYKLATSLQKDSLAVLHSTISAAEWMVVYKAARTALGFTATGLGIEASTIFDIRTLYTDYLLDTSMMPVEEAKKNLIAKAISNVLLRFTGASDLVGDAVKHGWGSSRAFPVLQKIMGSSEFKDAVLKEFMRLGGDVGNYVAKETIEEVLARIIKGGIEEEPEKKEAEAEESLPLATREEYPETLPKVSLEPSPEGAKLIAEAEQDLTAQPKWTISARDKLNKVLTMPLSNEQQSFVKKRLSELSSEWLFSEEVFAGDVLSTNYQVKPGESISSIARTNKVPYEILMEVNRIKDPRSVQAGKEIKLIHGPFHAVVYRSTFTMDLYLQKTFVRSFRVGLGQLGRETPTGLWRVKQNGKLIKPPWPDPDSRKVLHYGDPGYALGSRWIGLDGVKGNAKGRTGFGIHGTKEPKTIGAESSRGCIRLHDSDVIFVYNLLVPVHSLVEVVE